MLPDAGNNTLNGNSYVGVGLTNGGARPKTSMNKYYNIFSKRLEEMELPDIDLEHNSPMNPEISTFARIG